MATDIEIANELRVKATFTDPDNDDELVDPDEVFLDITAPEGTSPQLTTYEYGVDPEVERVSVGIYRALVFVDVAGSWTYRWRVEGDIRGAKTGCFTAHEGCGDE